MLKSGNKTGIIGRPKDFAQRTILATECLLKYKFTVPTVIDYMDGKVNAAYAAAPVRVTITDLDGNIAYYAGRGPFDFKIPKIEKALKRIIAGAGYMPPAPPIQWGEAVDGLRCGLSIDPADAVVGDDVTVKIALENTSKAPITAFIKPDGLLDGLVIQNRKGNTLAVEAAKDNSRFSRRFRGRDTGLQEIAPGKSLEREVNAKIAGAAGGQTVSAGKYTGRFSFEVNDDMLSGVDAVDAALAWVGKTQSGACQLDVSLVRKEGCMDCHSKSDYHHKSNKDCAMCHVGKMGTDTFDVKKDQCSGCHKREGKFGRRKIFGADGDFDKASKHIPGMINDSECLKCHDQSAHGDGQVSLIDPHSDGKKAWTGSRTAFCLTCHDNNADGLHDKSSFGKSVHGKKLGENACSHCHNSHGSENRALLKRPYAISGKAANGDITAGYALCWSCHDEAKVMGAENAFGKLHDKHVKKKNVPCIACHDVHGGADEGKPGMIDLAYGIEKGSGAQYIDHRDASTSFGLESGGQEGYCYIQCHQKHAPKKYSRAKKTNTVVHSKHQ